MTIDVDENLEPLMIHLKKEFERLNPEAKLNLVFKPAKNVIANLLNGDVGLIIISRDFDAEEKSFIDTHKIEMQRYEIAIDAVGFIVNVNSPVSRLTSNDLREIFSGGYKDWSQIESQNEEQNENIRKKLTGKFNKIKLFIQRPNSSTYSFVKDSILAGLEYTKSAQICSTSAQMLEMIRKNKNAIGISNLSWLSKGNQDKLDSTVKTVRISKIHSSGRQDDFAQFHQGLVFNKKYPYRRKVILYTTDFGIKLSTGLITFLLSKEGQKIILNNGLVPINQPIRTIQIN
jgi:phosphate transport system substrate-binding protein